MGCGDDNRKCESHAFVVEDMNYLKEMDDRMSTVVHRIEISIATMTENLSETRRTNERLEALLAKVNRKEEETRKKVEDLSGLFGNFKTRVVTIGSVMVLLTSIAGWIFDKMFLIKG